MKKKIIKIVECFFTCHHFEEEKVYANTETQFYARHFFCCYMKMNLHYASTPLCRLEDWHELEKMEKFIKHITVMDSQSENEYNHFETHFFFLLIFRRNVFFLLWNDNFWTGSSAVIFFFPLETTLLKLI